MLEERDEIDESLTAWLSVLPSLMLGCKNEDGVAMPLLTISYSTTLDCLVGWLLPLAIVKTSEC